MQYTIRNIPEEVDRAAREQAERQGRSLNEVLVEGLRIGLGLDMPTKKRRDLSGIFDGEPLEPEVLEALEEQRRMIDPELWG